MDTFANFRLRNANAPQTPGSLVPSSLCTWHRLEPAILALLMRCSCGTAGMDDPARLATSKSISAAVSTINSSYPDYLDLRDQTKVLSELGAFADDQAIHLSTAQKGTLRGAASPSLLLRRFASRPRWAGRFSLDDSTSVT